MAYSIDLRKTIIRYIEAGGSRSEATEIFGVSLKTIWNWLQKKKEGNLASKVRVTPPKKIRGDLLLEFIQSHPDAYLREIAEHFGASIQAVFYACRRHKISLKKRRPSTKKGMKSKGLPFSKR